MSLEQRKDYYNLKNTPKIIKTKALAIRDSSSRFKFMSVLNLNKKMGNTHFTKSTMDANYRREQQGSMKHTQRASSNPSSSMKSEDSLVCHICYADPISNVFMPCGHGGLCFKCAIDIFNTKGDCHLCKQVKSKM